MTQQFILVVVFSNFILCSDGFGAEQNATNAQIENLIATGKYKQATVLLKELLKNTPKDSHALANLARAYGGLGEDSAAFAAADLAVKEGAQDPLAWYARANILGKMGRLRESISDYDRAIELDSKFVRAYVNRGQRYQDLNRLPEAISNFSTSISLDPKGKHYWLRGFAYLMTGKLQLALTDLDKAVRDPSLSRKELTSALIDRSNCLSLLGKSDKAQADLKRALQLDPNDARALALFAAFYLKEPEARIQYCTKAISIDPRLPAAFSFRAQAYYILKDYESALTDFNQAVSLDPFSFDNRFQLVDCLRKLNKFEEARAEVTSILSLKATTAREFEIRGILNSESGKLDESTKDFQKAVELSPNLPLVHFRLAENYYALHKFNEALTESELGLKAEPKDWRYHYLKAKSFFRLGKLENALQEDSQVIAANPSFYSSYNNRAATYLELGKKQDAIRDASKAIELNPELGESFETRGAAYYQLGQYDKALPDLTSSLNIFQKQNSKNKDQIRFAYTYKAKSNSALGYHKEAISDWNELIKISGEQAGADLFFLRAGDKLRTQDLAGAAQDFLIGLERTSVWLRLGLSALLLLAVCACVHLGRIVRKRAQST